MGVYFKSGNWYIDYSVAGRRKREKVAPDKKLAELALKKRLIQIAECKFLDLDRIEKILFADFADEYLKIHSKQHKGYRTESKIINHFKRYFARKYLHEITVLDIQRYKTERIEQVAPATVNRALAILKSMFNRAIEWGKARDNPMRKIKLLRENNKRLRFLEREEIGKLLSCCSPHLLPIVKLALNTGMRKGEILRLKWQDIDFKRDIAYLQETKSGEKREIPLNNTAKNTLLAMPKHPDSPYVFCNKEGEPYGDIKKSWLTAVKKACIINFHFHDLRHTFASQLVMSGVDLNTVRELLGHHSFEMTLRYSHLSPGHKKQAVDTLDKRFDTSLTLDAKSETAEVFTQAQLANNT
ncbi:MAG: site-specific integrase [Candidatus Omnitrophica bacterium]|nr:site-specific integrase [Candidatus Omnitrophota bacterium]